MGLCVSKAINYNTKQLFFEFVPLVKSTKGGKITLYSL